MASRKKTIFLFLPLVCVCLFFLIHCENAVLCAEDSQCPNGSICDKGACVPKCESDGACASGNICQNGRCVTKAIVDAGGEKNAVEENPAEKSVLPEEAATEPTAEAAPETEPTAEAAPETEPTLEAAPETEPTAEAAPEAEPTLEAAPEPEPTLEATPEPEPTPEPPPQETCTPTLEDCNSQDDDCDGKIDEALVRPCYTGPQGTVGQGNCKNGAQACNNGQWDVACTGETLPNPETCNNQDDDCDGKTDEDLTRPCYTGPQGTSGQGACKEGQQICANGQWPTACTGQVLPKAEECNNQDDDCDGKTDESLTRSCYTGPQGSAGKGPCKNGTQACTNGQWPTACTGQVLPTTETCNNQDDDCDGQIDEGITRSCYTGPQGTAGKGPCKNGTQACTNGQWATACAGQVLPGTETCNNQDDDCDGQIDESLTRSCYTGPQNTAGRGQCKNGTQACTNGQWAVACAGQVLPTTETCNNQDDDCDGQIDEGITRSCYTGPQGTAGRGQCKNGTQACTNGQWAVACAGQVLPGTETCNNQDDDCDGQIDEGITRSCYTGPQGTAGRGQCKNGTQACTNGQWAVACTGQVLPSTEICSGAGDEDCDGLIGNKGSHCCGVSGGYLYCWFRQRRTWTDARNACVTWGGQLAGAANAQQNTYIAGISEGSTWLGGIYNHQTVTGMWISGKIWSYTNWAVAFGEPNNAGGSEIYVETNAYGTPGLWNDSANTSNFSYACERVVTNCTSDANCPAATPRCDPAGFCIK